MHDQDGCGLSFVALIIAFIPFICILGSSFFGLLLQSHGLEWCGWPTGDLGGLDPLSHALLEAFFSVRLPTCLSLLPNSQPIERAYWPTWTAQPCVSSAERELRRQKYRG